MKVDHPKRYNLAHVLAVEIDTNRPAAPSNVEIIEAVAAKLAELAERAGKGANLKAEYFCELPFDTVDRGPTDLTNERRKHP